MSEYEFIEIILVETAQSILKVDKKNILKTA